MIGIIYCFSIIGTQTHNYRGEAVAVTGFEEEVAEAWQSFTTL